MANNSPSKIAANRRYRDKTYDRIEIALPKGSREFYSQEAKKREMSVTSFFKLSIDEYIKNNPVEEKEE